MQFKKTAVAATFFLFFSAGGGYGQFAQAETSNKGQMDIRVPSKKHPTPASVVATIGSTQRKKYVIHIRPGFYEGKIHMDGRDFDDKEIEFRCHPTKKKSVILFSDDPYTIAIQTLPVGRTILTIKDCVIINTKSFSPGLPDAWQTAVLFSNVYVRMYNNAIVSASDGIGLDRSLEELWRNTIIASRVGVQHYSSRPGSFSRQNKIWGPQIGHYFVKSNTSIQGDTVVEVDVPTLDFDKCGITDKEVLSMIERGIPLPECLLEK